ncbi:unnamed protein product, partial [Allacma fusca]
ICNQEAAHSNLGIHFVGSNRMVPCVPTGEPENGVHMTKCTNEIKSLQPGSNNAIIPSVLFHYDQRPTSPEILCQAKWILRIKAK